MKARATSTIDRPVRTSIIYLEWIVEPFPIPATPMIPSPAVDTFGGHLSLAFIFVTSGEQSPLSSQQISPCAKTPDTQSGLATDGALLTCAPDGEAVLKSTNGRSLSLRVVEKDLDVPCNGNMSGPAMENPYAK